MRPFFLWVHYIEPHAPYRFHNEYAERLGVNDDQLKKRDRYDTEIAAVDASIARLLAGVRKRVDESELLVVLTADHGESLGEHNYWGHGRYLYEPSLRIPLRDRLERPHPVGDRRLAGHAPGYRPDRARSRRSQGVRPTFRERTGRGRHGPGRRSRKLRTVTRPTAVPSTAAPTTATGSVPRGSCRWASLRAIARRS